MARVTCSQQARACLDLLTAEARRAVEQRVAYLREMPRMYAITDDDRYPGCRTFWVNPCYRVFYMVSVCGDDVHLVAVVEEEVDAPGEVNW